MVTVQQHSGAPGGFKYGINKLANETLTQIFLSGSLTLSTNPEKSNSPAFSLLLVCRHWNALALSLPSLWTTLNLDFYNLGKSRRREEAEVILWKFAGLCLSRSSNQHLHLTLCSLIEEPMENLARLGAPSDRWASLNLSTNNLLDIINDRQNFSGFPALRSLVTRVHLSYDWDSSGAQGTIVDGDDIIRSAGDPDLGFLALRHFNVCIRLGLSTVDREGSEGTFLSLPSDLRSNITHLSMEQCSHPSTLSARMREVLTAGMGSLTHLHLNLPRMRIEWDETTPPYPGHLTLPHVTFLSISSLSCRSNGMRDDAWRNLDYLMLPSLKHLRVTQIMPEDEDIHRNPYLTRFLSRGLRIQTLATQQIGLTHSIALFEALKPEMLFVSNSFNNPAMRRTLCKLLEDILDAKPPVAQVRTIMIYDTAPCGALLAGDVLKTFKKQSTGDDPLVLCANAGDGSKKIVLRSQSRVPPSTLKDYGGVGDFLAAADVKLDFGSAFPRHLPQQWWLTGLENWN